MGKKVHSQTLSQGITEHWDMMHKYDKLVITATDWNWKCCTQFKKLLSYHIITHAAVSVIVSVLAASLKQ